MSVLSSNVADLPTLKHRLAAHFGETQYQQDHEKR